MMAHSSKKAFRRVLYEKREEIAGSLKDGMKKFMSGEIRQNVSAGQDECDFSVVHELEYMSCRQFEAKREGIRKIDLALQRMDEGHYGFCEECSATISMKRLRAVPFELLCRDCQEEREWRLAQGF